MPPDTTAPTISVVMSTYNRAGLLEGALRSILAQRAAPPFELVVVDNNSTDQTRATVEALSREDARVRYVFEGRQGVSYGRNAGVAAVRGEIIAFTDDDVRATPDWVATVARAFANHPDADYIGGKVKAIWPTTPPRWLTDAHWSPLALIDYGDEPLRITPADFRCVITANMAIRRSVFDAVGGFNPHHQHLPRAVSAIEDHELQLRLLGEGYRGWYVPMIQTTADVQPKRLTVRYHLRWWFDHGRAAARMTPPGYVFDGGGFLRRANTKGKRLMGIPLYLLRGAIQEFSRAVRYGARLDRESALFHLGRSYEQLGSAHYHATIRARGLDAGVHTVPPRDAIVTSWYGTVTGE